MIVQEHKNAKLWSNICSMLSNQENGQLRLAVQMLSKSVANTVRKHYPFETHKDAEFSEMINNLFYIFSVRNSEGFKTENSFLKLFTSNANERFEWLCHTFLPYFRK